MVPHSCPRLLLRPTILPIVRPSLAHHWLSAMDGLACAQLEEDEALLFTSPRIMSAASAAALSVLSGCSCMAPSEVMLTQRSPCHNSGNTSGTTAAGRQARRQRASLSIKQRPTQKTWGGGAAALLLLPG